MPAWLVALLPVFSALLGVVVANQASARRDTISRLWEQRTHTYLEVMDWNLRVGREVIINENRNDLSSDDFHRIKMPEDLFVRLLAFASDSVQTSYENCRTALNVLESQSFDRPTDYSPTEDDVKQMLEQSLYDLAIVVRKELSTGNLRLPHRLRRRIQKYSTSLE